MLPRRFPSICALVLAACSSVGRGVLDLEIVDDKKTESILIRDYSDNYHKEYIVDKGAVSYLELSLGLIKGNLKLTHDGKAEMGSEIIYLEKYKALDIENILNAADANGDRKVDISEAHDLAYGILRTQRK